jgi:hypothetical protein
MSAPDTDIWEFLRKDAAEVAAWPKAKRDHADAWWKSVLDGQAAQAQQREYCGHCGRHTGGSTCGACYGY